MSIKELGSRLGDVLSPEQLIMAAELCSACEVDGKRPALVARPQDAGQVGKILALCSEGKWAVIPWGSGVHMRVGNVPAAYDLGLDLGGLDQVFEYDADNLTLTAGAGCTLKNLERLLEAREQILPLDPPMRGRATLGGVIASNAFGPSRLRYGGVRDITLGLQVALPNGQIIDVGGKTVKNVAGYDLTKVFVGSYGSLGVITRATCRLLPRPEQSSTLVADFASLDDAESVAKKILDSPLLPTRLDVLGGVQLPGRADGVISLVAGIDGARKTIERQTRDIRRMAMDGNALTVDVLDSAEEMLRIVRDLPNTTRVPLVIRAGLPIATVGRFWRAVTNLEAEKQASVSVLARVGLGVVYVMIETAEAMLAAVGETIQQLAGGLGGYAVVERLPPDPKARLDVWGPIRDDWPLMQGLKAKFDPDGIMSPGRFVGRL